MTKTAFCNRFYRISYNPAYLTRSVLVGRLGKLAIANRVHAFAFEDVATDMLLMTVGRSSPNGHWPTSLAILDILGVDSVDELAEDQPLTGEEGDDDDDGDDHEP